MDVILTGGEPMIFGLSGDSSLEVALDSGGEIHVDLTTPTYLDTDVYEEEFEVSPDFEGTTLETAHKFLTNDIVVHPIQVEKVSNLSGGVTVYIGGII